MIHILAAFAQHEGEQISERTKAALAAAKARGVLLGKHGKVLAAENRAEARAFAQGIRSHVELAQAAGHKTLREIGDFLTARGMKAPGGGIWHANTVARVIRRF